MIKQLELEDVITGVVCLHCGLQTPIASSTSQGDSTRVSKTQRSHISIIRCIACGREAPYLADEIVVLKKNSNTVSNAA